MQFLKRALPTILAAALLAGCAGPVAQPQPEPSIHSGLIAYVPLDDRPDSAERVEYLASSLGYGLTMPEEDWYATKLDGQPTNQNGTQSGDRAALYEWVLAQEADGCDRYILSLDQLLSGGLVASRHMAQSEAVTLSDGTVLEERALLASLLTALSADPDNQVWLLDSVMRLAPTTGYAGFGLSEYNALRAYGMAARPALSGDKLTVENIVADYCLAPDGSLIAAKSDEPLPENAVRDYLAARERKLRLSDEVERILAGDGYENFHLLMGIDDSSAEDSIQKNEIAYLRAGLRTGGDGAAMDWLLSGVDDLAFKAVTKLYLEESNWGGAVAQVLYYGGTEDSPACDYDYQPLTAIMAEHFDFFGLRQDGAGDTLDLQILVLTQPADKTRLAEYYTRLIERLSECEQTRLPTILIDASNGAYGTAFHDALTEDARLGYLLSYAGFLDMAIVTGTALSHGVARYALLTDARFAGADDLANLAFQQSLTESIVLDFCYKNVVREDILAYVRNDLGGDPNNFCAPSIDVDAVTQRLSDGMERSAKAVLKNLSHSNLLVSLDETAENGGLAGWGKVTLSGWSFPWLRAFEVRMDILPGAVSAPHKKLLGFWF